MTVAIVTGAGRGIGAACAARLAAAGHDVVVGYHRDGEAAASVVAGCGKRGVRAEVRLAGFLP